MRENTERRRMVRLSVTQHLSGSLLEIRLARLLDLSAEGARMEHPDPLRESVVCLLDVPPALGRRLRLTARIVWTPAPQDRALPGRGHSKLVPEWPHLRERNPPPAEGAAGGARDPRKRGPCCAARGRGEDPR